MSSDFSYYAYAQSVLDKLRDETRKMSAREIQELRSCVMKDAMKMFDIYGISAEINNVFARSDILPCDEISKLLSYAGRRSYYSNANQIAQNEKQATSRGYFFVANLEALYTLFKERAAEEHAAAGAATTEAEADPHNVEAEDAKSDAAAGAAAALDSESAADDDADASTSIIFQTPLDRFAAEFGTGLSREQVTRKFEFEKEHKTQRYLRIMADYAAAISNYKCDKRFFSDGKDENENGNETDDDE